MLEPLTVETSVRALQKNGRVSSPRQATWTSQVPKILECTSWILGQRPLSDGHFGGPGMPQRGFA